MQMINQVEKYLRETQFLTFIFGKLWILTRRYPSLACSEIAWKIEEKLGKLQA